MADQSCEEFRASSAELALDILDAEERSVLLDHARHCPACRRELLALDETADRLLDLSPPVEPPVGFETAVLARLRRPAEPGLPAARRRWPRLGAAVAAVVIAAALVAGGFGLGRHVGGPQRSEPGVATAVLRSGHRAVGQAIASAGPSPWIAVAVALPNGDRWVTCKLLLRNGSTVKVGSFRLADGYGYWRAPLPATAASVTGAELTGPGGRLVATATLAIDAHSPSGY